MNSYVTFHDLWIHIWIHVYEEYREIIPEFMCTKVPDVRHRRVGIYSFCRRWQPPKLQHSGRRVRRRACWPAAGPASIYDLHLHVPMFLARNMSEYASCTTYVPIMFCSCMEHDIHVSVMLQTCSTVPVMFHLLVPACSDRDMFFFARHVSAFSVHVWNMTWTWLEHDWKMIHVLAFCLMFLPCSTHTSGNLPLVNIVDIYKYHIYLNVFWISRYPYTNRNIHLLMGHIQYWISINISLNIYINIYKYLFFWNNDLN